MNEEQLGKWYIIGHLKKLLSQTNNCDISRFDPRKINALYYYY